MCLKYAWYILKVYSNRALFGYFSRDRSQKTEEKRQPQTN